MNIKAFLEKLPTAIKADAIAGMQCTVQLNVSTPVIISIDEGVCSIVEGTADDADVTLTTSDENLVEIMTGRLGGVMAFMTGKLKVDGDIMLAKEIPDCFDAAKLA